MASLHYQPPGLWRVCFEDERCRPSSAALHHTRLATIICDRPGYSLLDPAARSRSLHVRRDIGPSFANRTFRQAEIVAVAGIIAREIDALVVQPRTVRVML